MAEKTIQRSALATAYAQALLQLAAERQQAEAVGQELRDLRQVIEAEPNFRRFMSDPGISHQERQQVMDRSFGGQVSPLMQNFLGVVSARGNGALLPEISEAYDVLLDEHLGRIHVDVTVAQALDEQQLGVVRERIGRALNKTAVVAQRVDEQIIGGLVLQVKDRLIDASVKTQLESIRRRMLASRPR